MMLNMGLSLYPAMRPASAEAEATYITNPDNGNTITNPDTGEKIITP